MQEEFEELENAPSVAPAGRVSFIRAGEHELQALLNRLGRGSKKALAVLEKGMLSEDLKLATDCAKNWLRFQMDVSKEISADDMQRVLAEFRFNRQGGGFKDVEDDNKPLVDFDSIQDV